MGERGLWDIYESMYYIYMILKKIHIYIYLGLVLVPVEHLFSICFILSFESWWLLNSCGKF